VTAPAPNVTDPMTAQAPIGTWAVVGSAHWMTPPNLAITVPAKVSPVTSA
jgi:hypothetical protein